MKGDLEGRWQKKKPAKGEEGGHHEKVPCARCLIVAPHTP
jgi:hypothetical protein